MKPTLVINMQAFMGRLKVNLDFFFPDQKMNAQYPGPDCK